MAGSNNSDDPNAPDEIVSPYPDSVSQNPAPFPLQGQDFNTQFQTLVNKIMVTFMAVLPDNYVSQVNGPFYTLQFQAIAEALAQIQLTAQQITLDFDHDFTRSEFLFPIIASLVFPDSEEEGLPVIDGDTTYRCFLQTMVRLLLLGAKKDAVQEGIEAISGLEVSIIERYLASRDPASAYTIDDQFIFEIFVEQNGGTSFPGDPFVTQNNVRLVLEALKPAHTLYEYSHLFRDAFGDIFDDAADDAMVWELEAYYYDDLRKFCYGAKEINGATGSTLSGRYLLSDPARSFESIPVGATVTIDTGSNAGLYRVVEVLQFPVSVDTTARAYTTTPSGLAGSATVSSGGVLTDASQDWSLAAEGEVLTFVEGSNAGSYRLEDVLGPNGGPLTQNPGSGTEVRVAPSILRVQPRMIEVATGQTYTVTVDRLGVREYKTRVAEDVSNQFYL